MNRIKAALAGFVVTLGSAASCAAADMPLADLPAFEPAPRPIAHARVVCGPYGRCFRVGPPRVVFAPVEVYPARPTFVPRPYRGPDYEVGRYDREPRFDAPDVEYHRREDYRRHAERDHEYDAPAARYRHGDGFRYSDNERERETWSHEYRRSEEGDER